MPRIAPDTFTNYVERSGPLTLRVSSWLGGTRLPLDGRDRLPVVAQSWEISDAADAKTSGEITFEVPNTPAFWPTTNCSRRSTRRPGNCGCPTTSNAS